MLETARRLELGCGWHYRVQVFLGLARVCSRGRVLQQRGYTQEGHSCDHAIEYGRGIVEQRSREAAIKRSASC